MPISEYSHMDKAVEPQMVVASISDVESNNVSASSKESEIVKIELLESIDLVARDGLKQEHLSGKPSEIQLNGIVIVDARNIRKALVNIPMSHTGTDRTLYVEEGDAFEDFVVTSIEKDRISLDWHGEVVVVTTDSGVKNLLQTGNSGKVEQDNFAKSDNKFQAVEDIVEEEFAVNADKVAHEEMHGESALSLDYRAPEYLSMAVFEESHLSDADEIEEEEDDELFPYSSFSD